MKPSNENGFQKDSFFFLSFFSFFFLWFSRLVSTVTQVYTLAEAAMEVQLVGSGQPVHCVFYGQFSDLGILRADDGVMCLCSVCQELLANLQTACTRCCPGGKPVPLWNIKASIAGGL